MNTEELIEVGLTKNQAEIYIELIKHPGQTAGKIAKILSIDRSFVYGILNNLSDKGLVSHIIKEDKKAFFASDPENLLKEIDEKRNKISKVVKEIKSLQEIKKEEKSVKVYEGKSGLKAYVRDFLESKEFYTLGGGGNLSILEVLKYEFPHYLKDIKKKKLVGKIITSKRNIKKLREMYVGSNVKSKFLDELKSQVNFTIFDNKLAIYTAEEKPLVIIIEDKKISESLFNYFNLLWKIAKP